MQEPLSFFVKAVQASVFNPREMLQIPGNRVDAWQLIILARDARHTLTHQHRHH